MDTQPCNRRRFHRINYDELVDLEFVDDAYESCQVRNISFGGMYVAGKFQQKKTESCKISLLRHPSGPGGGVRLQISAVIAWVSEEGVGLEFTSMARDSYMLLLTTLINNAEQPAVILHEFPRSCPFEIRDV